MPVERIELSPFRSGLSDRRGCRYATLAKRKRRDSNAQDALSNVRRVSGPVQLAISATLPKAEPQQIKPVELSKPCGLPRFERGGLANVPEGSNGR